VIRQLGHRGQPEVTRYVLALFRWFVRRHRDLADPLSRILTPFEARVVGL